MKLNFIVADVNSRSNTFSIGIIDTFGFTATVETLDRCLKTADVHFVRMDKISSGIVSVVIKGDVAAVTSSIQAGIEAAKKLGGYKSHTIIARIDDQIREMLYSDGPHKIKTAQQKPLKEDSNSNKDKENKTSEIKSELDKEVLFEALKECSSAEDTESTEAKTFQPKAEQLHNRRKVPEATKESKVEDQTTEEGSNQTLDKKTLQAMNVQELRKLARSLDLNTMDRDTIKRARKSDLIRSILSE